MEEKMQEGRPVNLERQREPSPKDPDLHRIPGARGGWTGYETHEKNCQCPPCSGRRKKEEGIPQKKMVSLRLRPEDVEFMREHGGPTEFVELAVKRARLFELKMRDEESL